MEIQGAAEIYQGTNFHYVRSFLYDLQVDLYTIIGQAAYHRGFLQYFVIILCSCATVMEVSWILFSALVSNRWRIIETVGSSTAYAAKTSLQFVT